MRYCTRACLADPGSLRPRVHATLGLCYPAQRVSGNIARYRQLSQMSVFYSSASDSSDVCGADQKGDEDALLGVIIMTIDTLQVHYWTRNSG